MSELENGFRLGDVIELIKRRSAYLVCAAALGVVAGFLAFVTAPSSYSSTARVQVTPTPADTTPSGGKTVVDIGTERDLVRSDEIAQTIRTKLHLDGESNKEIFAGLTVTANEGSSVLQFTVVSSSASRSRDIVNATAEAYTQQRRATVKAAYDRLVEKKDALDAEIAKAENDKAATGLTDSEKAIIQSRLNGMYDQQTDLSTQVNAYGDPSTAGAEVSKLAALPDPGLSKLAIARGVGVFGLFVAIGFGLALLADRRDALGGGRRSVGHIAPEANVRLMPSAANRRASPAEIDAAIDRLAVELVGGATMPGQRARGVLVVGTTGEPPVAMAEELASSLTFAGIPALFVLAGSAEREVRDAQVITSFADLITGPSVTGPASLPANAGATTAAPPTVTWLRPRGSAEASGLLRRAVIEALVNRAGREGFEAVVFVAATPTKNAAAAALGQWVDKTAVIVQGDDAPEVEAAVKALVEADVHIHEVVWA
jgi:capsular polysaccharide biosynthesis protein